MAFDAYIKIAGIEGESTDDHHPGWIEIIRFGVGVKQNIVAAPSSCGGACAGRADFRRVLIRKMLDKASPKLALACAAGTHIDEVVMQLCRAGETQLPYMTYTMKNCIISRVTTGSGRDVSRGFPAETVAIDYGTIEWRYTVQRRKGGGPAGHVIHGWDRQRNCKM
jgi:type VI secretion system secreted protein Hcp